MKNKTELEILEAKLILKYPILALLSNFIILQMGKQMPRKLFNFQ